MDDFNTTSLHESKNEWGVRLLTILCPLVIEGFRSIFEESCKLCKDNDEMDKYLMTFQVYLSGIPKWNKTMVDTSVKRAVEFTRCGYLEDLITCIHVIQLKALSCVRVCQKQKKVDINIPAIDVFLHRVYSNVARKVYMNIYLYEKDISPLQIQKNNRELEHIIKECILNTIRDTMPIETILRSYMDETEEQTVIVREEMSGGTPSNNENKKSDVPPQTQDHTKQEAIPITSPKPSVAPASAGDNEIVVSKVATTSVPLINNTSNVKSVGFSDTDYTMDENGKKSTLDAPKTIERLERLSMEKQIKDNELYDGSGGDHNKLIIGNDVDIDIDIDELDDPESNNKNLLEGIEILEL